MKKKWTFVVLLLLAIVAKAATLDEGQARRIASQFAESMRRQPAGPNRLSAARLDLRGGSSQGDALYVFNVAHNGGYVVVAGDDAAPLVLGYARQGAFDWHAAPANLKQWLLLNARYVEQCRRQGAPTRHQPMRAGEVVVAPLLGDILWGQGDPYNAYCPTYTTGGNTQHYYVGCVATAATQIMRYHSYPPKGTGTKSYQVDGKTVTADFGATTYRWEEMLPSYEQADATPAQKDAVATLAAQFGVAVEMEYAPAGSGAHSMMVPGALRDYFNYDAAATLRVRDYYDSQEWLELIERELGAGRPVYYAASSDDGSGGHAFVCDGYDSQGFVHINWGWTGKSNGYFLINHLNPDDLGIGAGTGGYNTHQEVVTGIQRPQATPARFERPLYSSLSLRLVESSATSLGVMLTLENFDTKPFAGEVGAAVTRGDSIVAVLKSAQVSIDGFAHGKTGVIPIYTLYGIPKSVGAGVPDGDARLRMVFREDAGSPWQLMRYCRGRDSKGKPYVGSFGVTIAGGQITDVSTACSRPDVVLLNRLEPADEVMAKGSALFRLELQNRSKEVTLSNIVIRFISAADTTKHYDYENPVHIYDASDERIDLLVNLSDSMPEGDYRLMAYEKGFSDVPFVETVPGGVVKVLPASPYPVMRLTQPVLWQCADGSDEVNQGDRVRFAMNARNYGSPGNVGAILCLVDVNDSTKSYVYQQANTQVGQGEAKTLSFYRKLPVDPGVYRVVVKYAVGDDVVMTDTRSADNSLLNVGPASDVLLNAVAVDLPDTIVKGERMTGTVTLEAPADYKGMVYVRMRQYTLTNGGILKMGTMTIPAGGQKSMNISQRIDFEPGHYLIMVEAKRGSTEGTVGNYAHCYKLIDVVDHLDPPELKGDVNADGIVNVTDVTCLINKILGVSSYPDSVCDLNGDRIINVTDVTALINLILAGSR